MVLARIDDKIITSAVPAIKNSGNILVMTSDNTRSSNSRIVAIVLPRIQVRSIDGWYTNGHVDIGKPLATFLPYSQYQARQFKQEWTDLSKDSIELVVRWNRRHDSYALLIQERRLLDASIGMAAPVDAIGLLNDRKRLNQRIKTTTTQMRKICEPWSL